MSISEQNNLIFGKTYDELFEKSFRQMTKGIEEHQFSHYNDSLGCHIYGKEHYKYEMKKRRMLPYDLCHDLADEWQKTNPEKEFDELSPKARYIIESIRLTSDKHGNIRLGDRAINALVEIGAISTTEHRPEYIGDGFSNT